MLNRRAFVGLIPISAVSLPIAAHGLQDLTPVKSSRLITSPPVVQHPRGDGFTISFAVSQFATGWVQWGLTENQLDQVAIAHDHGLIQASDRALSIRVHLPPSISPDATIHYRIAAQPLHYKNAYQLERGPVEMSRVYAVRMPGPHSQAITVAIVNDTHEQLETLKALHSRIDQIGADVLVWNGDTCNDFDAKDDPMQIVLNPGNDIGHGWASERPLLFVPGNHDVRGARARELMAGLSGWPAQHDLPYCFAVRLGSLALIGLDTGEDKPDAHPVFAGTAAYEPYRVSQANWLKSIVQRPEIASATTRIAVCHIPLRGLPGENDGTSLEGYAAYSGFGSHLWLPILRTAKFDAVISGHTHRHRVDEVTETETIKQIVGGGPQPDKATIVLLRVTDVGIKLSIEDLNGNLQYECSFPT